MWFITFLKWLFGASEGGMEPSASAPNPSGGNLVELIMELEGVKYRPYKDNVYLDTIGVGHLIIKDDKNLVSVVGHQDVSRLMQYPMTHSQVMDLLELDLRKFQEFIGNMFPMLSQNEEDAIVSLTFNIGQSAFKRSTMAAYLTGKVSKIEVARQFPVWRLAGGQVTPGLQKRRAVEATIFLGEKVAREEFLKPLNGRLRRDVQKHLDTYWG